MDNVLFNVTIHVCNAETGEAETMNGTVEFSCDPEQYGNGYSMLVKMPCEPWGMQGYDIRYDRDFDPDQMLLFIVRFFANRYDGKPYQYGTHWKLLGIRVCEAEEVE